MVKDRHRRGEDGAPPFDGGQVLPPVTVDGYRGTVTASRDTTEASRVTVEASKVTVEEHDFFSVGQTPRVSARVLTPATLSEMAAPGTTNEELGGFFGMTEDEFLEAVNADPALGKALKLAAAAGRAIVKRQQYRMARAGDSTMLRHVGEHMLGQNSKLNLGGEIVVRVVRDFDE